MKAITHSKLMALWFKMWEMFDHFLLRFDPEKVKEVMKEPTHKFWMNLTEHLLKPLMFVPGEGLKLVKVHHVGRVPAMDLRNTLQDVYGREILTTGNFPRYSEQEDFNRVLEFKPGDVESAEEFLKRFLGTSEDRSQLPKSLYASRSLLTVGCLHQVLLHGEEYGIRLEPRDRALFFMQGEGLTVRIIYAECSKVGTSLSTNGGSIFGLDLRSANRIFIADPGNLIPDPVAA